MARSRTSISDPLRVNFVEAPVPARLGMTFAPGKVQSGALTGSWERDLATDLDRLQAVFGVDVLVSVMEQPELQALGIGGLAGALEARGMRWLHLSVADGDVPSDDAAWVGAMRAVRGELAAGRTVVVHCKGGLGRTGTFVASLLTSYGEGPEEAIATVRNARPGAVENARQEAYVDTARTAWRAYEASRVRASLLGGAIGDALGAPVEFAMLGEILKTHGEAGVRDFAQIHFARGAITDDTQMTLFTAEGLLRAHARWEDRGLCHPPSVVEHAYYRWYWTQGNPVPESLESMTESWLFEEDRLHHQRAPGNTCLSALRQRIRARVDGTELRSPLNDSKGCGGVMRVAPVGLVASDPDTAWELACECAELTHAHPAGYDSAGLLAEILCEVMQGTRLAAAAPRVWADRRAACHPDTQTAIDAAFELLQRGKPPTPTAVESLGGGWIGEEALAISLYCALACPDFESALSLAVTHSGDSDSTGAITGNLLGADLGVEAIPERWIEGVELRDVVDRIASDLVKLRLDGTVDEAVYPGW